jgi:hypothetical protein
MPVPDFSGVTDAISSVPSIATIATIGFSAMGVMMNEMASDREQCEEDPCKPHIQSCVSAGKNVENHVFDRKRGDHLHSKPCKNLLSAVRKAEAAGCTSRAGVQYGRGVYISYCEGSWEGRPGYPDYPPTFPPIE